MKYKGKISDPLDLVTKQWTETTVNSAETRAINTAAGDATTKANAAETNSKSYAKSYTDSALSQAKAYTDSQIYAAINASY